MYWRKDRSTTSLVACEADCIFSIRNFWVFIIISSVFQKKKRYVSPTDATKSAFTFLFLSSVSWNFGFCLGFEILQVSFWTKFYLFRVGKWWRKHTSLSLSSCIKLFKEIWDLTAHMTWCISTYSYSFVFAQKSFVFYLRIYWPMQLCHLLGNDFEDKLWLERSSRVFFLECSFGA